MQMQVLVKQSSPSPASIRIQSGSCSAGIIAAITVTITHQPEHPFDITLAHSALPAYLYIRNLLCWHIYISATCFAGISATCAFVASAQRDAEAWVLLRRDERRWSGGWGRGAEHGRACAGRGCFAFKDGVLWDLEV
jgi:hypothetical protein